MAGGRPPKFETPEELQEAIEQYIKKRGNEEKPITMSGMAYELGFASRRKKLSIGTYSNQGSEWKFLELPNRGLRNDV